MSWLCFLLLIIFSCGVYSEDDAPPSPFVVPTVWTRNVEFYDTEDVRYGIFLDKVTFMEARQICVAKSGNLLELMDEDVGDFIASALGESAVGSSSLWIGGEYMPATVEEPGVWKWISGDILNPKGIPADQHFPMDEPPYWVDRPNLNSTERACLVTDRCMHQRPLITGLPCFVKRPFICAIVGLNSSSEPFELVPSVTSYKKVYHLYHAEYTWQQSFSMCQKLGLQLAQITKQEEFLKLQNRMQRVRPIMENAWVGGAFLQGKWIWVATNEDIRTDVNATQDPPPWYRPHNITMEGCLLADRHICDYFAYVEARCDRKRGFICQQVVKKEDHKLVKVTDNLYVSTIKLSWDEAQATCQTCLKFGTLLQLAFHYKPLLEAQLKWLFLAMTSIAGTEIRHIWLNGYLFNETFHWGKDKEKVLQDDHRLNYTLSETKFSNKSGSMLSVHGENGYIVFCPGDFKADPYLSNFKCLNLDRENLKSFFMYGLSCQYKQHFLCMVEDGNGAASVIQDTCDQPIYGPDQDSVRQKLIEDRKRNRRNRKGRG